MKLPVLLLLTAPFLAFGQLDSNTLTVTASRPLNAQPDLAVFNLSVDASPTMGIDDIVAALQNAGITAANLSGVNTQSDGAVGWTFHLPVPLAKTQTTVASLMALQQAIAKANNGLTLSFYISGLQVSDALAQLQTCPFADLISDARAQAQKLAQAAGLSAGPILSINAGGSAATPPLTASAIDAVLSLSLLLGSVEAPAPSGCALVVKFQLLRYQ